MILHVARAFHFIGFVEPPWNSWKMAEKGLAITFASTLRRPRWAMPKNDLTDTEIAAALDDLLECRDHAFAAIEAVTLEPVYLTLRKVSKPSASISLLRMAFLPLRREGDLLVRTLDALLQPTLLFGIGDVHELDAERAAIGALQDIDDLPHRGAFRARARCRGRSDGRGRWGPEAVGGGIEFRMLFRVLELERIEIGGEMAADAVGADHHQRLDAVVGGRASPRRPRGRWRRSSRSGSGGLGALALQLGGNLGRKMLFEGDPVAVEGSSALIDGLRRPSRRGPRRGCAASPDHRSCWQKNSASGRPRRRGPSDILRMRSSMNWAFPP